MPLNPCGLIQNCDIYFDSNLKKNKKLIQNGINNFLQNSTNKLQLATQWGVPFVTSLDTDVLLEWLKSTFSCFRCSSELVGPPEQISWALKVQFFHVTNCLFYFYFRNISEWNMNLMWEIDRWKHVGTNMATEQKVCPGVLELFLKPTFVCNLVN